MVHLITLGGRYDKLSLSFTILPEHSYGFPKTAQFLETGDEFQSESSADRQEMDFTISYSLLPELQFGIGFKRITQDYRFFDKKLFSNNGLISVGDSSADYEVYGPTLNAGSQVCLANWLNANISLYGNFSYGFLKTEWSNNSNDATRYHSADVGVSFELPSEFLESYQLKSEIRLGYRAQTIYTEVYGGDGTDATEGFTVGLRVVF
jgi:hypothetical protein